MKPVLKFLSDEDGAATIDMVVLAAAGVAASVAMTNSVRDTMSGLVDGISLSAASVNNSTSFGGAGENGG